MRRLAQFARALVRHLRAGAPAAPADLQARRLETCAGCERMSPAGVCEACGCVVRRKARWADQSCPLGRWPAQ